MKTKTMITRSDRILSMPVVGDDGTAEERHALGIDKLEAGSLNEGEGMCRPVTGGTACGTDLPGEVAKEKNGDTIH